MTATENRSSKRAKREFAQAVDTTHGKRTEVSNPMHMAYDDRDTPIYHLTPRARRMLGFDPFASELQ